MDQTLIDRVLGMLYGVHLGDAAGVPWETMTRAQILAATGGVGVTGYSFPRQTKVIDTLMASPGDTSDDTQLTLMVLESLVAEGGLDLQDLACRMTDVYDQNCAGWGRTTIVATIEMREWLISGGTRGRKYDQPAAPSTDPKCGLGTGPAMKIAPLAAFMAIRHGYNQAQDPFIQAARSLGQMTHSDIRASIASVAIGAAVIGGLLTDHEPDFHLRRRMLSWSALAEGFLDRSPTDPPAFTKILEQALEHTSSIGELRTHVAPGFSSLEAVPLACAIFLIYKNDFNAGIRAAVNSGGDTDTTASMVGAMIGARLGASQIPEQPWLIGINPEKRHLYRKLAEALIYSATSTA